MSAFNELNPDQRREAINTSQRYQALRDARARVRDCRGSMVWSSTKGHEYLLRSTYDKKGLRRQISLGARSPATERIKADYERSRADASARLAELLQVLERQAAVNRALGLGRVPLIGARVIRSLDQNGLLGSGIRVLGTNALYAYESIAGVHIDPGLTTTEDVDLLLDSRGGLSFVATDDVEEASLLRILQRVDRSFERTGQAFCAVNRDGYLVDLIKPMRNPPWKADASTIGDFPDDLAAAENAGLAWHESAPAFEAIAIDEQGEPLRIVTSDPRVFAAHKLWLSKRADRQPIKRHRDREQAEAVAALTTSHLQHLPFDRDALRMLPKDVVDDVAPLFASKPSPPPAPPKRAAASRSSRR